MRKFTLALAVSVLINVFLAGALIAGYVSVRQGGGPINAGALRIAGSELPQSERRPFRMALREARRAMHPAVLDARAAKAEAATLLRQPNVDQVAVMAALDRARAADGLVRAAVERRAVAFAAGLPPADRARLSDAMLRRAQVRPQPAR